MAEGTECLKQICDSFNSSLWLIDTYDGPSKSYYVCRINGNLKNEQEVVTTDTSLNTKSNEDVTLVYYNHDHTVKFIPNSLFDTFVNLEYLFIHFGNKFETMKREFLRNAIKLKNLQIRYNSVQQIDGNVFSEAKSLEYINFWKNHIKSIHKEAFSGLSNLQGVYLQGNKIKNLHPKSFSFIANLNILELSGAENCVNREFFSASQNFPEIERIISSRCTYEPFPDEDKNLKQAKIQIGSLTVEAQSNQEKFKEMSNKLEELKAEISSQEDKLVKEHVDHFTLKPNLPNRKWSCCKSGSLRLGSK